MQFFGPASILFPFYLISTFLISLFWVKNNSQSTWKESLRALFSVDVWFTKSFLIDLEFCIVMIFGLRFLLAPFEDWIFHKDLIFLGDLLRTKSGIVWNFKTTPLIEGILATIVTMVSIDCASYFVHRWMHSNPMLRKIHAVHHSAEQLTFLTTYRQHPLEPILLNGARSFAAAMGLAIFHWFFPMQTPVITIFGIGAGFFIYMFTVNLHHSHIPVRYPKFLRVVLISPHIHHLHHGRNARYFGKNFGVVFSFWDRMLGSYHEENLEIGELCFGLENPEDIFSYSHSFKKWFKKLPTSATARALFWLF